MTKPEQNVANAEDLLETILGVADELDPPVPSPKQRKPQAAP